MAETGTGVIYPTPGGTLTVGVVGDTLLMTLPQTDEAPAAVARVLVVMPTAFTAAQRDAIVELVKRVGRPDELPTAEATTGRYTAAAECKRNEQVVVLKLSPAIP